MRAKPAVASDAWGDPMKIHTLSLIGAAGLGFATAAVGFGAWSARPASAQFAPPAVIPSGISPVSPVGGIQSTTSPQPIAIQGLDPKTFVVASREPRLVARLGQGGPVQNMVVTVVTHYTVREDRL